jgi:hypothetical protein
MGTGCSDSDGGPTGATGSCPVSTAQELLDRVIVDWLDVDYSLNNPDGNTDSDNDGLIDTNDAVNFIESLKSLGYQIPETTIDGLYNNYYTPYGYEPVDSSHNIGFSYSLDSLVSQFDLQGRDWSGLEPGDMIFVDYDTDFNWDFCALYIGVYNTYTHAVIFASDYYDKVVIEDLDDASGSILALDIDSGYSDVRKPDLDHFADYCAP